MSTFIGKTYEQNTPFLLGDLERRDGVYVLGRPGTGKSSLLVNMAAQDIKSGHGIFFLDPHRDAVNDIISRADIEGRENDIVLLDPELDGRSFSINLLQAADIHNEKARDEAYDRARKFFERLWGKEDGLGLYLHSSLDHTLYTFIENPGLTLLEVPDFLTDPAFRRRLVTNMRYEDARFWTDFDRKRDSDQREFVAPLLTRLQPLLANRSIKRIVGQCATTIDIPSLLQKGAIILVRLSGNLSDNVRQFIGTLLVGELLRAIKKRGTVAESERKHFCVFIDEVQSFTDHDDVAFLFQQARKYGIATTAAHQERHGQLMGESKILGATDTAGTKIFFRLSPKDAEEQAGEFERDPPKETRFEREMVVSREPVTDLLRGHGSPDVQAFTEAFFRPLKERTEDIKAYLERARLVRQLDMDEAQLWRAAERYASARPRSEIAYSEVREKIAGSEFVLNRAYRESEHILAMFDAGEELRLAVRVLNKLLAGAMDGTARVGSETFAERLVALASHTSRIPAEHAELFSLYIRLQYGDPTAPRAVPYELARKNGLFTDVVRSIEGDATAKLLREKEAYISAAWAEHEANEEKIRVETAQREARFLENAKKQLNGYVPRRSELWSPPIEVVNLLDYFIILSETMEVRSLLSGLYSSKFTRRWRSAICPDVNALVGEILNKAHDHRAVKADIKMRAKKEGWSGDSLGRRFFSEKTLDDFCQFIKNNGEGAIVVLTFLDAAQKRWLASPHIDLVPGTVFDYGYSAFNALCIPTVESLEPLQTMQLIEQLSTRLAKRDVTAECDKYYWLGEDITGGKHEAAFAYLRKREWKSGSSGAKGPAALLDNALAKLVGYEFYWLSREAHIAEARRRHEGRHAFPEFRRSLLASLTEIPEAYRKESERDLKGDFETLRKEPEGAILSKELRALTGSNVLAAAYLQRRACDIFAFGESVADLTFPLPSLPGRSREQVQEVVRWLVGKLRSTDESREDIARRGRKAQTEANIQYNCDRKYGSAQALVPATMPPLPIRVNDRERLLQACIDRLQAVPGVGGALVAVRELVDFCALLSMKENQLIVPSPRMIAKEVPAARGSDMRHEMQRELQGLDPYLAHVSTIVKAGGEARTIKVKLRTPDKPAEKDADALWERWTAIETSVRKYYAKHDDIDREIQQRRGARGQEGSGGRDTDQREPAISQRPGVPPSSIVKEPRP